MTDQQPDMIAQAGALLRMLQDGQEISRFAVTDDLQIDADSAIVQASAILAVAAELRDIRNILAESITSTSSTEEAPNAQ